MKLDSAPRIRLRTLFILTACAAIGLTTSHEFLTATRSAIDAAMVIGLLQQVRQLSRVGVLPPNVRFAAAYAILWRIVVASAMAFFVIVDLGGWGATIWHTDRDELLFYEPASAIYELLPIIVLASSIRRWKSSDDRVPNGTSTRLLFCLIAFLIMSFIVIDGRLVEYLTHKAMVGIEASIPPRFQRPGVYPNHASEGYRSFWPSLAAAMTIPVGVVCWLSSKRRTLAVRRLCITAFAFCLILQAVYCLWFYSVEFHRIAPDMAGAGLAAVARDWISAAIHIAAITTAISYCVATPVRERTTISANLANDLDITSIYETVPCLAAMFLAAAFTVSMTTVGLVREMVDLRFFQLSTWLEVWLIFGMLCNPTFVLILAQSCLVFQLCYIRWRRRRQEVRWELPALCQREFAANWIASALAILVGVPTLGAFGFLFWLGPFNFSGI